MSRSVPWAPSSRTWSPRARASWTSHVTSTRSGASRSPQARPWSTSGIDLEPRLGAERGEEGVLLGHGPLELRPERGLVEEVLEADARARRAILVRRPDPPAGRPDLRPAEPGLAGDVERPVVRQDHVRGEARPEPARVDAARGQRVELVDQRRRVDDDARPDERDDVRIEDPGRDEVELEDLVAEHQRVAGVVAALVADDEGGLLGEEVGGLALPLVAPLEPDDDGGGHQRGPDTKEPRSTPGFRIHHSLGSLAAELARRFVEGAHPPRGTNDAPPSSNGRSPVRAGEPAVGSRTGRVYQRGPARRRSGPARRWDVRWRAGRTSGMADPRRPARHTDDVTRLLGGLALLASFGLIAAWIAVPTAFDSWFSEGAHSLIAAVMAALVGVVMTALLVFAYSRFRLPRLVRAAERMAEGELGVTVGAKPVGRRPRGPPRARARSALRRDRRDDRRRDDRPADRREQPRDAPRVALRGGRAGEPLRASAVGRVRRHRPLQVGQRHVRPRRRRRRPAGRRPDDQGQPPDAPTPSAATAARSSCSS